MKKYLFVLVALVLPFASLQAAELAAILNGEQRSEASRARDIFRHPGETLAFFRVEPTMTVVEIWPGSGWYTEILAPLLKDEGQLFGAHFPANTPVAYFNKVRDAFVAKLEADPGSYGAVEVVEFSPGKGVLEVPDGSADRVLTFRNVHNWLRDNSEQQAFELFFKALKPGGMLGVVEHRAPPGKDRQWMLDKGYMTEASVIALAEAAGFVLVARSEINANPKDSADHPAGVWSLPPTLRLGDTGRDTYLAIGESDRMTLLFSKP